MKVHVVREPFSVGGKDYARGAEITDPAEIEAVKQSHGRHLIQRHHDAGAPAEQKADAQE